MIASYKTILISKKKLVSNVFLFTFKLLDPPEINFKAGQYLILRVRGKPRLYSIASPEIVKDKLEFIIELVPGGLASEYLRGLEENDKVDFFGPAGSFTLRESLREKVFLVTGTGIAPARSIIETETKRLRDLETKEKSPSLPISQSPSIQLFWGLKNYDDVYLFDELKLLTTNYQLLTIKICLSRENNLYMVSEEERKFFDLGHVDFCLEREFNNGTMKPWNNYDFYLCGSSHVVESLKLFLLSKNVPKDQILFEKF